MNHCGREEPPPGDGGSMQRRQQQQQQQSPQPQPPSMPEMDPPPSVSTPPRAGRSGGNGNDSKRSIIHEGLVQETEVGGFEDGEDDQEAKDGDWRQRRRRRRRVVTASSPSPCSPPPSPPSPLYYCAACSHLRGNCPIHRHNQRQGSHGSSDSGSIIGQGKRNSIVPCRRFEDAYDVLEEIGRGAFCAVYKVRKKAQRTWDAHAHSSAVAAVSLPTLTTKTKPPLRRAFGSASFLRGLLLPQQHSNPHDNDDDDDDRKDYSSGDRNRSPRRRRSRRFRSLSSPSSLSSPEAWLAKKGLAVERGSASNSPRETHPSTDNSLGTGAPSLALPSSDSASPASISCHRRSSSSSRRPGGEALYAAKVFNLRLITPKQSHQLKNEIDALKTLDHRSIVKMYETFTCRSTKRLMLIMELCTGGDLYARMPYRESEAVRVIHQVLNALVYMHNRNIVHRDIKLENILFESNHPQAAVKLVDFGLAAQLGTHASAATNSVLKERVGTLYCMAPCMLIGTGYTCLADIWSVGVVTYTMLSGGSQPFHGKTPKQVVARILQCDYSFDGDSRSDGRNAWTDVSEDAKNFIRGLLRIKPEDRLTAEQAIRHVWIQRGRRSLSLDSSASNATFFTGPASTADQDNASFAAADPDLKQRVTFEMVRYAEWTTDFRKLALNAIAKRSTSEEIFELRKVFDEFDTENTGTITLNDFRAALSQLGPSYPEDYLREMFRKIDIGGTSVIKYTEFLAAALEAQGNIDEWRLAEAFALLDDDDSGYISRKNLRRIVGPDADESYIDRLIEEAGGSPSEGQISYTDFLRAFGMQTHDLVYDMYETSKGSMPTQGATETPQLASDASMNTDEILERSGIPVIRSRSSGLCTAKMAAQRRRFRSAMAASLRLLAPVSSGDIHSHILTGQRGER